MRSTFDNLYYSNKADIETEILDGDSGSWVVDETTGEVYGHLVASDMFGDGYVVPIHAAFDDIKSRLNLFSVSLPAMQNILSLSHPSPLSTVSTHQAFFKYTSKQGAESWSL